MTICYVATQYAIAKEVKSNPKKPSCKKVCSSQEGYCVEFKVAAKKWL